MASRLLSFPDPVNEVAARTVASGVVVMVVITLATRQWWISVVLAAGFLARVASGPRFSPLGQFATRLVAPRLAAHTRFVPGPPKRFAQAIGATFSLVAMTLWLAGASAASAAVLGALGLAAMLEAVFALCLGCQVFAQLMRAGIIPESICLACADLSRARAVPRAATQTLSARRAGTMNRGSVGALFASCHPGPVVAVSAMSAAYALDIGRGPGGTLAVTAAVLSGQLSVGWQNDAVDAGRDRLATRRDKPVARGEISARAVGIAAVLAGLATVPLSLWSGWRAGTVHLLAVALATAYNLGLKATALSPLPYLGAFGLLPLFITMGAPGTPLPPWWVPSATALLGLGAHFLNVVPDRDHDRLTGVLGVPQRLAANTGVACAGLAFTGASALLSFGTGEASAARDVGFAASLALAAAACGAALARPQRRLAFQLAIGLAVLDVVLLLSFGHH